MVQLTECIYLNIFKHGGLSTSIKLNTMYKNNN